MIKPTSDELNTQLFIKKLCQNDLITGSCILHEDLSVSCETVCSCNWIGLARCIFSKLQSPEYILQCGCDLTSKNIKHILPLRVI